MKMKHTNIISTVKKAFALLLTFVFILPLASCDSRVDDAVSVLADNFDGLWQFGPYTVKSIEQFTKDDTICYYMNFDHDDVDDGFVNVTCIIVSDMDDKTVEKYIHSVDFERRVENKAVYDAYLEDVESGDVYVFTEDEIKEIQEKLEEKIAS